MVTTRWLGAVSLALAVLGGTTTAGTISMQVSCRADGTNLFVQLMNRGDEAAQNVSAMVTFQGKQFQSGAVSSLPPNQPVSTVVAVQPAESPGTYPAVVLVHFEDLNAYPFSSVSIVPVRVNPTGASSLSAALDGGKIRGKRTLKLRVRSQSPAALQVSGRVVMAREMVTDTPEFRLDIPPNGRETVDVPVENFSAMPASRYAVHVILEYDQGGQHYTTIASTPVQLFGKPALLSTGFWVVLVIVLGALAASVLFGVKRGPKKPAA